MRTQGRDWWGPLYSAVAERSIRERWTAVIAHALLNRQTGAARAGRTDELLAGMWEMRAWAWCVVVLCWTARGRVFELGLACLPPMVGGWSGGCDGGGGGVVLTPLTPLAAVTLLEARVAVLMRLTRGFRGSEKRTDKIISRVASDRKLAQKHLASYPYLAAWKWSRRWRKSVRPSGRRAVAGAATAWNGQCAAARDRIPVTWVRSKVVGG